MDIFVVVFIILFFIPFVFSNLYFKQTKMEKLILSILPIIMLLVILLSLPMHGLMNAGSIVVPSAKKMIDVDQGTESKGDYLITLYEDHDFPEYATVFHYLISFIGLTVVEPRLKLLFMIKELIIIKEFAILPQD